jgi:hypothetical protein
MCIFRVIYIRLDTTLNELSGKKEKRNHLGLGYFRAFKRFFLYNWRWFFHRTLWFCFIVSVYYYIASMKIDSMRSHNISIMLSLSLFFSRHLTKKRMRCNRQPVSFSLSLSVSFITSSLFSTRGYYCLYTKKKSNNNNSERLVFIVYIIYILLFYLF